MGTQESQPDGRCAWPPCGKPIEAGRFCTGKHYNLYAAKYGGRPGDERAADEPEQRVADLVSYARDHVTSPGAQALLDEVERGQLRRSGRVAEYAGDDAGASQRRGSRVDGSRQQRGRPEESADETVLRMLGGATFGAGARLILPSGQALDGAGAQAWTSAFAGDEPGNGDGRAAGRLRQPRKGCPQARSVPPMEPAGTAGDSYPGSGQGAGEDRGAPAAGGGVPRAGPPSPLETTLARPSGTGAWARQAGLRLRGRAQAERLRAVRDAVAAGRALARQRKG